MVTSDTLNKISFWVALGLLAVYAVYVLIIAIVFPYFQFVVEKPFAFIMELILVPTLTCLPIALIAYHRNVNFKNGAILVIALWIKLLIIHVLLEISGFYAWTMSFSAHVGGPEQVKSD